MQYKSVRIACVYFISEHPIVSKGETEKELEVAH
jgi:hypothetical protein